jgi:hypothetical protein
MSKWTIRNRASVMTFDIEVVVYMKEQLEEAVAWLVEHNYSYEWDCFMGDSLELDKYSLRVQNFPWASNLEKFAKVLGKSDHGSDLPQETEE